MIWSDFLFPGLCVFRSCGPVATSSSPRCSASRSSPRRRRCALGCAAGCRAARRISIADYGCTARSGKRYRARFRLYRSQILQLNMRLKALAEIYTVHSFAQLCNLNFLSKFCNILQHFAKFAKKISTCLQHFAIVLQKFAKSAREKMIFLEILKNAKTCVFGR